MSLLLFLSYFSGHFWSAFLVLLLLAVKRSRRTTKLDLKCPEKDSKSKRDTKNSILVSISGNTAEKFSDSLCLSENYFGLHFQKTKYHTKLPFFHTKVPFKRKAWDLRPKSYMILIEIKIEARYPKKNSQTPQNKNRENLNRSNLGQ